MRNEYLALSAHCLEGGEPAPMDFIINQHVNSSRRIFIDMSRSFAAHHFPFDESDDRRLVGKLPSYIFS